MSETHPAGCFIKQSYQTTDNENPDRETTERQTQTPTAISLRPEL